MKGWGCSKYQEVIVYDMKNLEANAPEAMKAFVVFDKAALAEGLSRESVRS